MLIPDQPEPYPHMMIGAGKENTIYLVDRDNMGGYNSSNNNQIIQSLAGGVVGSVFSTPGFWQNNVYYAAVSDNVNNSTAQRPAIDDLDRRKPQQDSVYRLDPSDIRQRSHQRRSLDYQSRRLPYPRTGGDACLRCVQRVA